jgi:hypothetical protein
MNRDHSLRSEANFLRKHEERRPYQTKYNVVGVLFITCFSISWQEVIIGHVSFGICRLLIFLK